MSAPVSVPGVVEGVGVGRVGGGIAANNGPNMVAEPGAQLPDGQSGGGQQSGVFLRGLGARGYSPHQQKPKNGFV